MIKSSYLDHKILINLSVIFSKPTGISTYATNLIPYLSSLNPTLLTAQKDPDYKSYSIPANLSPEQGVKGHLRRLLWTQFQIPKIYQKLGASLLFSPIPEAPLGTNCRFVVVVHDLIPLRFPKAFSPLTPYFRYYIPQVLNQAEHIICDSLATAKDITNFCHISAAKITPIPLAYDAEHFYPRKLSNRQQNPPYFLYIGRHNRYKNLHRLISAFAAIPNCRDYQLWLAGSSDKRYTPKLHQQAEELDLTEQIKFLDYVSYAELPKIISGAIALVFPTLWEGFGIPVLEAMATGTPVITSNLSSLPEVAGEAAILVDPYSTAEITTAMVAITQDNELRSHLITLGFQRAKQFSWAKTGQATVEVLQQYI